MEPEIFAPFYSELVIGAMFAIFGALLRHWFQGVVKQIDRIIDKVETLVDDFHGHQVDDAKSFARLNADVNNIYKTMDRRNPRSIN